VEPAPAIQAPAAGAEAPVTAIEPEITPQWLIRQNQLRISQ
jgi:hypothetical protein